MKQTLIIVTIFWASCSFAQNSLPVISFGDRKPDLYYWDTNWYDQYERDNPGQAPYPGYRQPYCIEPNPADMFIGRACVADTPILVQGIAAAMRIGLRPQSSIRLIIDTTIQGRLPEQFKLYDANLNLLEESTLHSSDTPSYRMQIRSMGSFDTLDVYEIRFEKPVLVNGQFYVGGTTHNNLLYGYSPEYGYASWMHPNSLYFSYRLQGKLPTPSLVLYKYYSTHISANPEDPYGNWYNFHDTTNYNISYYDSFIPFFAIIDTSYAYFDCQKPTSLGVISADEDSVVVAWSGNALGWDARVWPDGTEPDSGTYFRVSTNQLALHNLNVNTEYNMKVMALCDTIDVNKSPWSDVFHFVISDYIVYPCPVPEGLNVHPTAEDGSVFASWNATDAESYIIAKTKCTQIENEMCKF